MKISAILLAAGLSKRMGRDKLLLDYNGKSLLQHSVDLLSGLPVYERIVITSKTRYESVILPSEISALINDKPETGISGSIKICLEAAKGTHYLFLNADQPKLTLADILPLIESALANQSKIVFPIIDSKPTSPAIFPESYRLELLNLSGDSGGRIVRDAHPELCLAVTPALPVNFEDIDNKGDYQDLFKE